MRFKQGTDRGVAGLTILLSVIVMLFVIGLLVMIFALMGAELQDATYDSTTVTVTNESLSWEDDGNVSVATVDERSFASFNITLLMNGTTVAGDNVTLVEGTHYTLFSNGTVFNLTDNTASSGARATYTYIWDADNTATDVMNETTTALSDVTDWFAIFIVITAMVVLILLTVIIITAIRGSGMVGGLGGRESEGTG